MEVVVGGPGRGWSRAFRAHLSLSSSSPKLFSPRPSLSHFPQMNKLKGKCAFFNAKKNGKSDFFPSPRSPSIDTASTIAPRACNCFCVHCTHFCNSLPLPIPPGAAHSREQRGEGEEVYLPASLHTWHRWGQEPTPHARRRLGMPLWVEEERKKTMFFSVHLSYLPPPLSLAQPQPRTV